MYNEKLEEKPLCHCVTSPLKKGSNNRKMKDSGIAWIGQIPENWETKRLKALFEFGKGLPITKEDLKEKGIPVISYGQIHSKTNSGVKIQDDLIRYVAESYLSSNPSSLVHKGDFIFADTSEDLEGCGNCVFIDEEITLFAGYHTIIFKVKTENNNRYLAYLFKTDNWRSQIRAKVTGVKLFSISRKILSETTVILPPLVEQTRIANFLDQKCSAIDSVLEKTKASIEEYKKLKHSVITQAVTKGIRPNRQMKDSGIKWIGQIPEKWKYVKMTRIQDNTRPYPIGDGDHGLIKPEDYRNSGIPYIRVQNLGWGTDLCLEGLVYISEEKNEKIKTSTLRPNDILFAKTGATIGKTGMVPHNILKANTTSHIGKLSVSKDHNPRYMFYVLSSYIGYRQFWEYALQKTTRPELTNDEIKSVCLLIPDSKQEEDEIASYLDKKCSEIDNIISKKEQLIKEVEAYKKSLIYEYVTGKKEVI